MQALLEFAPVVGFFAAYYVSGRDFYVATIVLMVGMAALLAVDWLRTRRIPPMHGASAALVFVLGAATLALHDERFIQWKPTVLFWALAAAFLVSQWIGAKPLSQRLLEGALGEHAAHVPRTRWLRVNVAWVLFYAAVGALNLWVASHFSQAVWVNFKFFGLSLLTLVFVLVQGLWLVRGASDAKTVPVPSPPFSIERMRVALEAALEPERLEIRDDSAQHAGHAGAREGGHFHVTIVSKRFAGLATLARHRLVYAALADWMGRGIHALSIDARVDL